MKLFKYLRILQVKKSTTNKNQYQVGDYMLKVPDNYGNIIFQRNYKLYDRFLPVLASSISSNQLIIDVGANVGDTTFALLQACSNPIISIEPSDLFYGYLMENINLLAEKDRKRIQLVKKLAGTGNISGELNHEGWGTAGLVLDTTQTQKTHVALDEIITNKSDVILIKSDTDGYDFDVLFSANQTMLESEPILFWENQMFEDFQYEGYVSLYESLKKNGYNHVFIFDNFGNLITEEKDYNTLQNINKYVYDMEKNNCTRTIYYTDVLACTDKHINKVRKAMEVYRKEWIEKK